MKKIILIILILPLLFWSCATIYPEHPAVKNVKRKTEKSNKEFGKNKFIAKKVKEKK